MIKKSVCMTSLLLIMVLLAGCWDRVEINDLAFVAGTAIDKEEDKYRVSVQFPLISQAGGSGGTGGGGGGSGEKSWFLDSSTGDTIGDAKKRQQATLSRKLYFAHRQVLLIGEDMARSGIAPIMDITARMPHNRLTSYVLITKGSARDVLNAEANVERIPAEMIRELNILFMKQPRMIKHIIDFIQSDGIDLAIPALELIKTEAGPEGEEKTTIRANKLAVFKEDKLAGILTEEETKGVLWAMGEINRPTITVQAPKGDGKKLTVQLNEQQVIMKPLVDGGDITINMHIKADGFVIENESSFALSGSENLVLLENEVAKELVSMVEKSIKALQDKYHSDAIGLGDVIYRKDPKAWHRLRNEWDEKYPEVTVNVIPIFHLEYSGSLIKPVAMEEEEENP